MSGRSIPFEPINTGSTSFFRLPTGQFRLVDRAIDKFYDFDSKAGELVYLGVSLSDHTGDFLAGVLVGMTVGRNP